MKPTYGSLQYILDTAVVGLATQGFQRTEAGHSNACVYTVDVDGEVRHCAVGHLMSEDMCDHIMDVGVNSASVNMLASDYTDFRYLFSAELQESGVLMTFLRELQQVHDDAKNPKHMVRLIELFAAAWSLDPTLLRTADALLDQGLLSSAPCGGA